MAENELRDLPEPLVPADCDCTDLDGFMLNVERLMASELVALSSHEVIASALFLWCRAWKQRPAASLPADDKVIAAFAKLPMSRFRKLREEVLHGFVLCSDGRMYHRVLAEEARKAYDRKVAFQRRRETDAERLRNWRASRDKSKDETRFNEVSCTNDETRVETRFVAEGQGQGQGQGQKKDPPQPPLPGGAQAGSRPARPEYPADFEAVWADYPPRAGGNSKRAAFRAWSARINSGVPAKAIRDGVLRYRRYLERSGKIGTEFVKQAATFFGPDEHYSQQWGEKQSGGNFYEGIEFPPDMVPMRIC